MTSKDNPALHPDTAGVDSMMERLKRELSNPPFHAVLRPEPERVEHDGTVIIKLAYKPEFSGRKGGDFFHGGVIASLIDLAMHAAVAIQTKQIAPTIDLRIDYLRPARAGDLFASAHVLKLGRHVSRTDVAIRSSEGELIAVGRGSFSTTPQHNARESDMRAVVIHKFGSPEDLHIENLPSVHPGPDQVKIDVQATAVNFVDLLVISGKYQFLPERPFTPGKLPVGIIREVGSNVTDLKPGDRVLTLAEHGGYAEQALALASEAYKLPDEMSFVEAASMSLAFDTAWFALRERARVRSEDVVLVLGATGSVGIAAIQLAKAFGCRVLAGVSSQARADVVYAAGADDIIDLSTTNLHDALRDQVHAVTDGKGADIIIDSLGDRFFAPALRALAWCGRLVVVGFAAGDIPTLNVNYLLLKNIEVSGLQVSDYRKRMPQRMKDCFDEIFELFKAGIIKPPLTIVEPLDKFSDALKQVQNRRTKGRIVLVP